MILCACGCGEMIKCKDRYGRNRKFINGHNGRKYEDKTQHKREWNHNNRESRYQLKKNYHRQRKVDLLLYKGGKCLNCGFQYNSKNAAAFEFHHRDPKTKSFQLGNNLVNFA